MLNLTPMVRNLLFLNLAFFLGQNFMGPVLNMLALYPVMSPLFQPFQFISYMFLHAGLGHIFSNMFGLISFGPLLEQRWGAKRFLIFWLVCGIGAGVLYSGVRYYELTAMNEARLAFQEQPSGLGFSDFFRDFAPTARGYEVVAAALQRNPTDAGLVSSANETLAAIYDSAMNGPMLGASGALFGILFAFAYLFPNTELMLLFFPFPIKAKYFVFLYGLYELYSGVHRTPGDNVAHFAHLGGMLIGFILLMIWQRSRTKMY
ncbi:rhomboid family intramembrane serine protease [Hymenobacter sp. DG25A]|jgi:membrane associated rhomboid family serine protease|uniref:rhomboid family intramembrane serine protease n=1 Tax=Hymenobacter sp. DG25A TaxID=1385663 RepID=UPI0006BC61C3|nr:rhomboid family intramembrane serine protease [Hymenobacter sp. DG25A]ALD21532.1 protease [Hymenobacter sp. DG25A]